MDESVKVSVIMPTYNHGKYIRQALDSVIEQKTNFIYEILVGDDGSTDDTQEILREYKRKYPDKIKLILHKKNIGATKNGYSIMRRSKGEYIAILEGDDYWCDNDKLQKQVDFLEEHKEYIACTHRYYRVDENGGLIDKPIPLDYSNKPYRFVNNECSMKDYEKIRMLPSHVNTLLFRNMFLNKSERFKEILFLHPISADQSTYVCILCHGNIYMFSEYMSAYRYVKKNGASNATSLELGVNKRADFYAYQCRLEKAAKKYWGGEVDLSKEKRNLLIGAVCVCMSDMTKENAKVVMDIVKCSGSPLATLLDICRIIAIKCYNKYIKKSDERILP